MMALPVSKCTFSKISMRCAVTRVLDFLRETLTVSVPPGLTVILLRYSA